MVVTGENAAERQVVYLDPSVLKWRLRCRVNDVARIYLKYTDRIEERVLVDVDQKRMTPGNLIKVNRWSVKADRTHRNFWAV